MCLASKPAEIARADAPPFNPSPSAGMAIAAATAEARRLRFMVLPGYSEWPTLPYLDAQRSCPVAIRNDIACRRGPGATPEGPPGCRGRAAPGRPGARRAGDPAT